MTAKRRPVIVHSIRALAKELGKGESTVRKWIASDDWKFPLQPPWDVAQVKAWMEIFRRGNTDTVLEKNIGAVDKGRGEYNGIGLLTKARIQSTLVRTRYLNQKFLVESGKLHDVAECERRRMQQILEVRTRLVELPRSMANSLVGLSADRIEQCLTDAVMAILDEFSGSSPAAPPEGSEDA